VHIDTVSKGYRVKHTMADEIQYLNVVTKDVMEEERDKRP